MMKSDKAIEIRSRKRSTLLAYLVTPPERKLLTVERDLFMTSGLYRYSPMGHPMGEYVIYFCMDWNNAAFYYTTNIKLKEHHDYELFDRINSKLKLNFQNRFAHVEKRKSESSYRLEWTSASIMLAIGRRS